MAEVKELLESYKTIRDRFLSPPNAVFDNGIDLKRKKEDPPSIVAEITEDVAEILPKRQPSAVVWVHEIIQAIDNNQIKQEEIKSFRIDVNMIIRAVADYFDVNITDIKSKSRKVQFTYPRHIVSHIAKRLTGMSLNAIARRMVRDHTTIMHSQQTIKKILPDRPDLQIAIREIEERILCGDYHKPTLAS
jgi:hypothetical protein